MSDKIISRKIDARKVSIKLMDGSVVRGKINLLQDEHLIERVSEIFTEIDKPFVVVFEATFEGRADRVIVVNKANILWVSPDE